MLLPGQVGRTRTTEATTMNTMKTAALAAVVCLVVGCQSPPPPGYHWAVGSEPYHGSPGMAVRDSDGHQVFAFGPKIWVEESPPTPQEIAAGKVRTCKRKADQLLADSPLGVRVTSPFMPRATTGELQEFGAERAERLAECERDPQAFDEAYRDYVRRMQEDVLR
jgi:hypothetical protein